MPSLPRDDRGSLLLLHLFLITAVVAVVAVIADVAAVIGTRQQLAATADQAAISGAQAVDLGAYYAGGAAGVAGVPLDPTAVDAAVRRFLAPAVAAQAVPGLSVAAIEVRDAEVTVRLSARAELPFTASVGLPSVPVSASATARLLVQPPG